MVAVPGKGVIGSKYKKTIYREYTDATFVTLKPRSSDWEHLGFLGPLIRAEVGDTIKVLFKNNGKHPFSMHPHGVFYEKASEGAQYSDGTTMNRGTTAPGGYAQLRVAGAGAGGSDRARSEHGDVDVPLACRREPGRQCRPHRPDGDYPPRRGAARRHAQ